MVSFCTMKFILQEQHTIGSYWFCLSWLGGWDLGYVFDKFLLVFSDDRYSFDCGIWKYSSTKPRISNLMYVCILSLNANSCAHIHLSHVWPKTAVQDFIYTNKCSPFYGKSWLTQQDFWNPQAFFKSYLHKQSSAGWGVQTSHVGNCWLLKSV